MSHVGRGYDVNQTFIVEPLDNGIPIFSACTAIYANFITSCDGNTSISLDDGIINFDGVLNTNSDLSANTIFASTYYGDGSNLTNINFGTIVTGLTINGDLTVTGNTLLNGLTGNIISATTISANTISATTISGITFYGDGSNLTNINFGTTVTGLTVNGDLTVTGNTLLNGLTANTISATTYQNLPVTADTFTTDFTYSSNTFTIFRNQGLSALTATIDVMSGLTINGDLTVTGNTTLQSISANTITGDTFFSGSTPLTTIINNIASLYSGSSSADYLALSGGTVTGSTTFTNGLTVNNSLLLSGASNPLTIKGLLSSNDTTLISIDNNGIIHTLPTSAITGTTSISNAATGGTYSNGTISLSGTGTLGTITGFTDFYVTGFTLSNSDLILKQNISDSYSAFTVNLPFLPLTGGTLTGSLTAPTYYGDGSNLTGISRGGSGGQLYYFNISNLQSPYYELSTSATTTSEQTISATTGSYGTVLVGGFMTPVGVPNTTSIPAGILSFYLHSYDGGNNHNFNIYCQLYKRDTGGTETLLFTSDQSAVIGNVVSMVITDGYFSGATLDASDRLVVKVYGENLTNQTRTIYFVSEGSQHYSFALTTIPIFLDTYVTGFTYSNNVFTIKQNNSQPDLPLTINSVTGWTVNGNLTVTGNTSLKELTASTISATTYYNIPLFSGGTITGLTVNGNLIVTGATSFTNGLTANTISATTYQNLPVTADTFTTGFTYTANTLTIFRNQGLSALTATIDVMTGLTINGNLIVTGNTTLQSLSSTTISGNTFISGNTQLSTVINNIASQYDPSGRFLNLSGGTVTGNTTFINGLSGSSITATTYFSGSTPLTSVIDNIASQYNPSGRFLSLSGGTVTGSTSFTAGLNANTISATTYQNLPVTADTFTTDFTYSSNTFTISRNQGLSALTASINTMTGLTVNGTLNATTISATTISATTFYGNGSNLTGISSSGTFTGGTVNGSTVFTNGLSANTFNITTIPTNNNSNTQILSRNSTTGNIEYTDSTSIGLTFNNIQRIAFLKI